MREPVAKNLRIFREKRGNAEIRARRHEFPDWQVLIPSRAGKRALGGNPHAPAKPVQVIEMGGNRIVCVLL